MDLTRVHSTLKRLNQRALPACTVDRARHKKMARHGRIGAILIVLALSCTKGPAAESATPRRFFLPQNPVAAAYILGRLSNEELIAAPRGEFVYVALLQRQGLDRKYRVEALEGLSRIRQTNALTELLRGLGELDAKGDEAIAPLQDLGQLLLQFSPADLAKARPALQKLAGESQLPKSRQIGFAAMVVADQTFEVCRKQVADQPQRQIDLLLAVPWVPSPQLRLEFFGEVERLCQTNSSPELLRAAMTALVAIPGHDAENFAVLEPIVATGTEKETAIACLLKISQRNWPQKLVAPLETNLVAYLQNIPASDRTGAPFTTALQLATEAATLLPEAESRTLQHTLRALGPAVFVLHAVYEQMRFDKSLLVVEAGKPVAITLQNEDAMPHNLAVLRPGALEEIGQAAEKMPAEPDAEGRLYVPVSPKVLYATKLVPPGQTARLAFTAPADCGDYPYVCTFPGHWRRMVGTLAVVQDVEVYLAAHAATLQPKITEWKLADLAPEVQRTGPARDLEQGRELFTKLACVQCHKLGRQGYAYGPDLTDVFTRYKQDRAGVLEQILEPSKVIEDRYRNFNFELKDAEPVTGLILAEDAESVTIQTGPADSLRQVLKKAEILKRAPLASSPMPVGLLNALSKEQILDLLAYLESGGRPSEHHHGQ